MREGDCPRGEDSRKAGDEGLKGREFREGEIKCEIDETTWSFV